MGGNSLSLAAPDKIYKVSFKTYNIPMLKRSSNLHGQIMKKLFLSTIFGLAAVFGIVGGLGASFHLTEHSVKADDASLILPRESAEALGGDEISATISSSALTNDSQTFKVSFSASTTIYNNGRYNNVFVRVLDSSFAAAEAAAISEAKRAEVEAGTAETYEPLVYDVAVYKMNYVKAGGNKNASHLVIPEYINSPTVTLTYPDGTKEDTYDYRFHVTEIDSEVVFSNNTTRALDWKNIESITIPSSVNNIADEALVGAKEAGATIYVVDDEETALSKGWPEDWTDTDNVVYGRCFQEGTAYNDLDKLYINPTNTSTQTLGKGNNYLLSCHITEAGYESSRYPFVLEYKINGTDTPVYEALPLYNTNAGAYYDGIGSSIGKTDLILSIDIPLKKGQSVDPSSLVFHNICPAIRRADGKSGFLPDLEAPSYYLVPRVSYSEPTVLNSIFGGYKVTSITSFFDYTDVKVTFDFDENCYYNVKPSSYLAHEEEIKNKTLIVRVQFDALANTNYKIEYKDGNGEIKTSYVRISTPITTTTIENHAEYGFMFTNSSVGEGFDPSRIVSLELVGFSLHLDLFNTVKNSITNNSKFDVRFASIILMDASSNVAPTSVPMIFLIAMLIYVVAFAALAFALYFYRKARYKNDEFRRVVTKKYVISALKNLIGFFIVLMAVLCILGRWVWLSNSVIVFNPIDVGVIIFTLVGAIFIGFTIKNLVNNIKLSVERRKKAKLRLDQDVVEDGTN